MGILLATRRPPGKTFIRSSVLPDRFRLMNATSKWRLDAGGGEPRRCADTTADNITRTIAAWSADWRCTTIITNENVTGVRKDPLLLPAVALAEVDEGLPDRRVAALDEVAQSTGAVNRALERR